MAYLSKVSSTQTSISFRVYGLQYQARYYNAFGAKVSWGVWKFVYPSSGDTNMYSPIITISGLSAGTTYTFNSQAVYSGTTYYLGDITASTDAAPQPPSTPSAPTLSTRGDNYLALDWPNVTGADDYDLRGIDWANTYYYNTSISAGTLSGLKYGTSYQCSVRACNEAGCSSYSTANTATTAPKTPTISLNSKGTTFINLNAWYMEGNYSGFRATVYNGGTYVKTVTSSTSPISITGLSAGITYTIYVDSYLDVGSRLYSLNQPYISVTTTNPPSQWNWTSGELSAFNNNGYTTSLTYTRWNSFLDKINEWRTYKGLSTVAFSKMTSVDKQMTASRFNAARSAIDAMNSTGIGTVYSRTSRVYGSYFITMATKLNSIS